MTKEEIKKYISDIVYMSSLANKAKNYQAESILVYNICEAINYILKNKENSK
jgi:hypothetical protein